MVAGLWVNSWIVLLAVGVDHVGSDGLGGDRLPPPQGPGRPARPAALQHADRDLLHDRAADPRGRLLRLHGARPDDPRDADRRPRRVDRRDRQAVGVGLPVQRRGRGRLGRRLVDGRPGAARRERRRRSGASCPTLYLPVDKTVKIQLQSRDVIHSFWIIDFLYKKDMYIGRDNFWSFTPTREGTYAGKCAELCGEYHSRDALQRQGRQRSRVRGLPRLAARRRPDR